MTTEVDLEYPIEVDGETVSSMKIRRPTFGDTEKFGKEKDNTKLSILMIVTLANVSPDAVRLLDISDFEKISEAMGEFFPKPEEPPET